jgi:hypothetical protein
MSPSYMQDPSRLFAGTSGIPSLSSIGVDAEAASTTGKTPTNKTSIKPNTPQRSAQPAIPSLSNVGQMTTQVQPGQTSLQPAAQPSAQTAMQPTAQQHVSSSSTCRRS